MGSQEFDVIVLGAGISGIAAARFYLEVHPECRLSLLEKDTCLGGVWNSRRAYEGFWTQWIVGTAEFSDIPMPRPPENDTYYDFFKAKYTTMYLEDYVDRRTYAGETLRERIRFGSHVHKVMKAREKWVIYSKDKTGDTHIFHATKLIVASGLTSRQYIPSLSGKEKFDRPIIHQENFGQSSILSSPDVQRVTVLGGAKSSADMVYASVKAGKKVSWIVRDTGTGPAFFLSPKGKGPYKNAFELGSIRVASTLSPSFLVPESWWTRFLHETKLGRKILQGIWTGANAEAMPPENIKHREKLLPHTPIFWQNGTGGLLNHTDFWETITDSVEIYQSDLRELDAGLVRLKSGEEVPTDVLLCGTGWLPALDFFDNDLLVTLDLPHEIADEPVEYSEKWATLEKEADQKVIQKFPMLATPPAHYTKPRTLTPYRLYNGIASIRDDSIVFIGHVLVGNYFSVTEAQAIWATAYLDKQLMLPSIAEREKQIALFTAWCRRRYLNNGENGNWMTFEFIVYSDHLLHEVGLSSNRKSWFKNLFSPCMMRDMAGLRDEYMAKYGNDTTALGASKHGLSS
ncbi:monooxygenase [Xylographa bjoerkii]|nr:monooxygenase [Xylographa bjoerkii]